MPASIQNLLALASVLALGACQSAPPPAPAAIVLPGAGKDRAAFQQDDLVCRQHAAALTGYGTTVPPQAGAVPPAAMPPPNDDLPSIPTNDIGYMQCMAARGDSVRQVPVAYGPAYAGPYPWGYPDPYPYGPYAGGFYGGVGFVLGGGRPYHHWGHEGWDHPGSGHGGFANRGFGRGGFGRAGAARGGFGHGGHR